MPINKLIFQANEDFIRLFCLGVDTDKSIFVVERTCGNQKTRANILKTSQTLKEPCQPKCSFVASGKLIPDASAPQTFIVTE